MNVVSRPGTLHEFPFHGRCRHVGSPCRPLVERRGLSAFIDGSLSRLPWVLASLLTPVSCIVGRSFPCDIYHGCPGSGLPHVAQVLRKNLLSEQLRPEGLLVGGPAQVRVALPDPSTHAHPHTVVVL